MLRLPLSLQLWFEQKKKRGLLTFQTQTELWLSAVLSCTHQHKSCWIPLVDLEHLYWSIEENILFTCWFKAHLLLRWPHKLYPSANPSSFLVYCSLLTRCGNDIARPRVTTTSCTWQLPLRPSVRECLDSSSEMTRGIHHKSVCPHKAGASIPNRDLQ